MDKQSYESLVKDYEQALTLKQAGNEAFKKQDYASALKEYSRIYLHIGMNSSMNIEAMFGAPASENGNSKSETEAQILEIRKKISQLRVSVCNNIAMVHLKRGDHAKVVENCERAIKFDKYNFKARLRRARANRHLKSADKALTDLKFLQGSGYRFDLQVKNELKLCEMKEFEKDDTVIDEAEEREKEAKIKAEEEEKREKWRQAKANKTTPSTVWRVWTDNKYLIIALLVMLVAVGAAAYYALS